jgi:virulence protein IcsB
MFGLNEINMIDEINEIKNLADMNKFDYVMASKTQNCAAIALRVLRSGGAEQFIPFNTSIISEYPNRAHAYAEAVQSKVDTLNRYVTEIDQHCEALLLNHETNAKWESFAKSSQSIDIDNNIKLIKQKMQIAPHLITRSELRITTMKHLDIKIARLSAKFDELSATASSKCRPLIIAKRECVPSASDTVNVLGRKAQALVEALHPHSVADGDRQTINPELMLTTQAIIKSIGELMAIQLT